MMPKLFEQILRTSNAGNDIWDQAKEIRMWAVVGYLVTIEEL